MTPVEEKTDPKAAGEELVLRTATAEDGAAIWQLVHDSGVLDVNSPYCYLILGRHFGDSCVVAEEAGKVLGFVVAYRPPTKPDVIFVWQVGVDAAARGRGLGGRILRRLVELPACRGVRYVEATVSPSNEPSKALFRSLARRLDTRCEESPYFGADLFPGSDHEREDLFRIGPFEL